MRRALVLSSVLLLAACGGEDEKAAYVEAATDVCADVEAEFEDLTVPATLEGASPYADQVVALLKEAQQGLTALTPPDDDRAELENKVLDPLAELVQEGEAYAAKVRAAGEDPGKLLTLLSQRPTAAGIDTEFLRAYGLESCAEAVEKAG